MPGLQQETVPPPRQASSRGSQQYPMSASAQTAPTLQHASPHLRSSAHEQIAAPSGGALHVHL